MDRTVGKYSNFAHLSVTFVSTDLSSVSMSMNKKLGESSSSVYALIRQSNQFDCSNRAKACGLSSTSICRPSVVFVEILRETPYFRNGLR